MTEDHRRLVRTRILDAETFVRATLSGRLSDDMPWRKLVIRPVLLKSGRHLQFSYFDDKRDITRNFAGGALLDALEETLLLPFANIVVQSTGGDVQVQITKKGKVTVHHSQPQQPRTVDLAHDHEKNVVLPTSDAHLRAVGIVTHDGKIKAGMGSKYKQINEFLKLMADTGTLGTFEHSPVRVLDAGCGNAYLTFALYHYLTEIKGLDVEMIGIDLKADLMEKHAQNAAQLGYRGLHFAMSSIIDYHMAHAPDIVVALHACDTATDDAIAQGIRWNSKMIVCAPCCQHHLQEQMHAAPQPFAPVLRYGILHERMGDLLTDSFRALTLRMMGYRTDVLQFIGDEHTPRNIMIRAVKTSNTGDPKLAQEYHDLKAFWGVTPYLENLLVNR